MLLGVTFGQKITALNVMSSRCPYPGLPSDASWTVKHDDHPRMKFKNLKVKLKPSKLVYWRTRGDNNPTQEIEIQQCRNALDGVFPVSIILDACDVPYHQRKCMKFKTLEIRLPQALCNTMVQFATLSTTSIREMRLAVECEMKYIIALTSMVNTYKVMRVNMV